MEQLFDSLKTVYILYLLVFCGLPVLVLIAWMIVWGSVAKRTVETAGKVSVAVVKNPEGTIDLMFALVIIICAIVGSIVMSPGVGTVVGGLVGAILYRLFLGTKKGKSPSKLVNEELRELRGDGKRRKKKEKPESGD